MKIELRRFTASERLSEETIAFTADLWIDGAKVGHCHNAGQGGPTNYYISDPAIRRAAEEYAHSLPDKVYPATDQMPSFSFKMDLEHLIDDLVEAELQKRHERAVRALKRRWCKTRVVYRVKSDPPGRYRLQPKIGGKYTRQQRDRIIGKFGAANIEEIVNETLGEVPA